MVAKKKVIKKGKKMKLIGMLFNKPDRIKKILVEFKKAGWLQFETENKKEVSIHKNEELVFILRKK